MGLWHSRVLFKRIQLKKEHCVYLYKNIKSLKSDFTAKLRSIEAHAYIYISIYISILFFLYGIYYVVLRAIAQEYPSAIRTIWVVSTNTGPLNELLCIQPDVCFDHNASICCCVFLSKMVHIDPLA